MKDLIVEIEQEEKIVEITQIFYSYRFKNTRGATTIKEGFRTKKKLLADIEKNFKNYDVKIKDVK